MNTRTNLEKGLVLCGLAFLIYGFGLGRGFMFDDQIYIAENPLLRRADAFRLFWFSSEAFNYYPLFWSLLRVQWTLWGDHAIGYHAVNLLLHTANAVLVWRIAAALRLPGAWWIGCLFAVHPINVQTVAWAAEQKNTWSFLFMALAFLAFVHHTRKADAASYLCSLLLFIAALACKTSTVLLPVFLAICFGFRDAKISWRMLLRLAPFFAMSLAAGMVTLWFEKNRVEAHSAMAALSLWERAEAAGAGVWFYLWKALAPVELTPMYRGWAATDAAAHTFVPGLLFVVLLAACAALWRRVGAPVVLGLIYYTVMLLPLLGFFDTNYFDYSQIADHWQYHALPGLLVSVVAACNGLAGKWPEFTPVMTARCGALAVVSLGALASLHFAHFEDARSLWTYVLERNPKAWIAWYNLGNTCADENDQQGASQAYERALQLRNFYPARFNLANSLAKSGRLPQAERAYLLAGRLKSDDAELHNNHGVVLLRLGRAGDAIAAFTRALELQPDLASAHTNLAVIFLRRGDVKNAARHFEPAAQSGDTNCRRVGVAIADALQSGVAPGEPLLQLAARACAAAENSHSKMASATHSAGSAH